MTSTVIAVTGYRRSISRIMPMMKFEAKSVPAHGWPLISLLRLYGFAALICCPAVQVAAESFDLCCILSFRRSRRLVWIVIGWRLALIQLALSFLFLFLFLGQVFLALFILEIWLCQFVTPLMAISDAERIREDLILL
jgi:hypothetical protein